MITMGSTHNHLALRGSVHAPRLCSLVMATASPHVGICGRHFFGRKANTTISAAPPSRAPPAPKLKPMHKTYVQHRQSQNYETQTEQSTKLKRPAVSWFRAT